MPDALSRALAAGATVVTPNRRLARHLVDAHDRAQRESGARAWASAKALPWPAFVAELEREAVAAGALEPRVRLGERASAELWRAAVEEDAPGPIDVAALAGSAAEAWELVHAWGAGRESWRAWSGGDDEPAAFARWAERYRAALDRLGAGDAATAPDRLARLEAPPGAWHGRQVALAGFLEVSPQQRRVADALRRAGASVDELPTIEAPSAIPSRVAYPSPDAELCGALGWARRTVERDRALRVGIVVPDLAQRRSAVRLRAIDVLGLPEDEDAGVPSWNLSLGAPIAEVPLVAAALDLVALAWTGLPVGRAAALLRSAHLPGAAGPARRARAELERTWLDRNLERIGVDDAIAALGQRNDPLAVRLAEVFETARRTTRASRRGWIDAWRAALAAAGWPGERPRSSAEHQAARALDEHFVAFAALDATSPGVLSAGAAIAGFGEIVAAAPFQPELPPAPIQILGLYEAIGLQFEALWVAGMTDEALPRAPRPHPLLPIAWQRERGVPRSDASRELAFAREAASWLLRAAPAVVVSHASMVDDRPSLPSEAFPPGTAMAADVPTLPAQAAFVRRPRLERVVDAIAPPVAAGERVGRGSGLVAAQSDCPFQALASRRWRADPWPETSIGLTAMERGTLVHEALAAFWGGVESHGALVALQRDAAAYDEAKRRSADAAIATIDGARWRRLPPAVRAQESERLVRALGDWLAVEASRSPFEVAGIEQAVTLSLPPLELDLRLDRVDRLADGGVAILDYKTGKVPRAARWTRDRPEATQMALYTLAWREAHPADRVRAAVLAQVKRGETQAVGLYADEDARIDSPSGKDDGSVTDWDALEARWGELMRSLATAFARGEAAAAPREASICRYCARQSLCRIDAVARDDEEEGA